MIKYVTRAAIVILLLLLAFWGFLAYRQQVSYKHAIHKNADLIIKINVDQLIRKVAINTIVNPSYYLGSEREDRRNEEKKRKDKGFRLPANIFVFNLKGSPSTFFSRMEVKDSANLKSFLQEKLRVKTFEHTDQHSYGISEDGRIQVLYTNEEVVLSYSFAKAEVRVLLEEMLFHVDSMETSGEMLEALKNTEGDITCLKGNNEVALQFENGQVVLNGVLEQLEDFIIPPTIQANSKDPNSSVHVWLAGQLGTKYIKNYQLKNLVLPLDSLLPYYQGYVALEIGGATKQQDSVVTYEYNEDFEKVETISVQEKEVPEIQLLLKGDVYNLKRLLEKESILKNNKLNRDLLPLYSLDLQESENTLVLGNVQAAKEPAFSVSPNFFNLFVDFKKLEEQQSIPWIIRNLRSLQELHISASKKDDVITLQGQLSLSHKNINSLIQLMDMDKESVENE